MERASVGIRRKNRWVSVYNINPKPKPKPKPKPNGFSVKRHKKTKTKTSVGFDRFVFANQKTRTKKKSVFGFEKNRQKTKRPKKTGFRLVWVNNTACRALGREGGGQGAG